MGLWDKMRQASGAGATPDQPASSREAAGREPPSARELFAAEVEAMVRESRFATSVRRTPDAYGLVVQRGGREQTIFLDNAFAESRDLSPDQRRERIARLLLGMDAPDATKMAWNEVRPKLAPLLRTPSLFGSLPKLDKRPLHRPFLPFLIECIGVDSDHGIAYAAPHMLEAWGVKAPDAFAAATENGRAYFVDDVAPFDPQAPYPLWHVARDDSYESSRLLVPGWLASFAGRVKGRPVAVVPHRSLLIVGGDGDERCLRRLIDTAKGEFQASPRGISPALYSVDDEDAVVPFVLPSDHPLAPDVAIGHVVLAMAEYNRQQQHLQAQIGNDIYVAPYKAVHADEGRVISYSIWSRGIPSLLPRTDEVALLVAPGDKHGEVLRVPWRALVDAVGVCLVQETDMDPPRWRATRWPEDGVLHKLRAVAVA